MSKEVKPAAICTLALLFLASCSDNSPLEADRYPDPPTVDEQIARDRAFVDVKVVPMTHEQILPSQTVVIREGEIAEIGPADAVVLPDTLPVVNGEGKYLMPGLTDMHTHVATSVRESGQFSPTEVVRAAQGELLAYLAFGVTTILNNGDFGAPLPEFARQVLEGEFPGPTMYTANYARGNTSTPDGGPVNKQVTSREDGINHVLRSRSEGYQFIKVYNHTPLAAFQGIVDEASTQGMAVIGHIPQGVGARRALENGMVMVAHAEAYLYTHFGMQEDKSLIQSAIDLSLQSDAFVTGTLSIQEKIAKAWGGNTAGINAILNHSANRFAHPTSLVIWRNGLFGRRWNPPGSFPGQLDSRFEFVKQYTRAFHDAGVKLLLGTDSPTVLGVAGYSVHEELQTFTQLGLTPFEILKIATVNAGEFIQRHVPGASEFGTVEVGKRADLILLNENPLEDVTNVQRRAGVMARGHWYSDAFLEEQLEQLARSYGN